MRIQLREAFREVMSSLKKLKEPKTVKTIGETQIFYLLSIQLLLIHMLCVHVNVLDVLITLLSLRNKINYIEYNIPSINSDFYIVIIGKSFILIIMDLMLTEFKVTLYND